MGGAESVVRNTDKRTSRREHRASFQEAIGRFRAAPFDSPLQASAAGQAAGPRCVRVCVRKRPFFPHEEQQGEFDVVSCLAGRVVVHDARMRPDMRNMVMNHHDFVFDEVFGEGVDNDAVYAATAHELVRSAADGFSGTIMCYGQTGSGKTFTMASIYEHMANDLFASVGDRVVTVCFIELLGDKCYDMLNGGTQCNLVTAVDGSVHPYPCVEVPVVDAVELRSLIDMAGKLRATAATGVHDQSSRSHACCRIFVANPSGAEGESSDGTLTLVDLAGTEHRIDSAEHNAERQREGAKINASLASLKECIRATAAGAKFVPFRRNWLTQLLRGCFSGTEPHTTVIVATVSPSSKDTEHSLNTLRHACIMDGQGTATAAQGAYVSGGSVTKEALGEINVTKIARERTTRRKSGTEKPSEQWSRPPPGHQAKQSNTARRPALDRQCLAKLPQRLSRELLAARAGGATERQRRRFARAPGRGAEAEEAMGERCPWPLEMKEATEDAQDKDVESLSPRCGRDAPLQDRAAHLEPQLPAEPSPRDAEEDVREDAPGVAKAAWQSSDCPSADQSLSQSQESSASAVAPAASVGECAAGAAAAEEAPAASVGECAAGAAAAEEAVSSASSSPRESVSAPASGGLSGSANSAPWLLCAAVAQDALQDLAAARRPRGSAQQIGSIAQKADSRLHEAKTSLRASASAAASHGTLSARQRTRTPRTSEVVQLRDSQQCLASQEDGSGPLNAATSTSEEYIQRRMDGSTAVGTREPRSCGLKPSVRAAKAPPRSQGMMKPLRRSRDTTAATQSADSSQPGPPSARDGRDRGRCYENSALGAELGRGVGADDGCPPWPPDNIIKDESNPPVVRSPAGNRDKSPRVIRSPRHSDGAVPRQSDGAAHVCPSGPSGPQALATDPAEGGDHDKAVALFRLFCSGGRNARDWRKNDLRLISTCVVPALFGERAKIDWAHPSAGLDELERLVVERPVLAEFCTHPSASSQAAHMQHRRSASGSGRGSPLVGSPGQVRHSRSPALRSSRDGGSHTSRPSTGDARDRPSVGDARECARDVSPLPPSPVPQQSSQVSLAEDCSPPPRRSKSSCLLPVRTPRGMDEAAAREPVPAVSRHRSSRSSKDEEIADLEWKVANTELGVKQWLTELRAAVRQDACAVST